MTGDTSPLREYLHHHRAELLAAMADQLAEHGTPEPGFIRLLAEAHSALAAVTDTINAKGQADE